ncbi:uncharacterized protein SCHCODRAFT_02549345 [Schizophyllum commune H4-8]|uniref:uncharacterized protein n=1 Tax=Schizophyllum commune (strain H4-8 / FGSC 9210) TaxID=578458 RepID=UPI002160B614
MSQKEPATTATITSVANHVIGQKLRVAGRLLAYDPPTCLGIVDNKDAALLVDLTLCADTWILEALQGCVMVTGYLERYNKAVPTQLLSPRNAAVQLHQEIVLKALIARATPDLDINLWDHAVRETHETSGELEREQSNG